MPYFLTDIFGKSYENNYCKTALNIFDVQLSKICVLNNKISLIFELLNFAFCFFAKFLSYLTPAPFLWRGSRLNQLGLHRNAIENTGFNNIIDS